MNIDAIHPWDYDYVAANERVSSSSHWSDPYRDKLTHRACNVLKLSIAESPQHVCELGYAYWSQRPNCGKLTMREFEVTFNGGATFGRNPKEVFRPYQGASMKALLDELLHRGYQITISTAEKQNEVSER